MSDISTGRRQLGIAAIATTALALPLTASISYANAQEPPALPEVPQPPEAPLAPLPPLPPQPPAPPAPPEHRILSIDPDGGFEAHANADGNGPLGEGEIDRIMAEVRVELEQARREMDAAMAEAEGARREVHIAMAQADRARAQADRARAAARSAYVVRTGEEARQSTDLRCNGDEPVVHRQLEDGRQVMMICHAAITEQALSGMRAARDAIASADHLSDEIRREILRSLDGQIEEMREREDETFYFETGAAPQASAGTMRIRVSTSVAPAPTLVSASSVSFSAPLVVKRAAEEDCEEEEETRWST